MSEPPANNHPLLHPPIHATPGRTSSSVLTWRTPNAPRAFGLDQRLNGTPRPHMSSGFARPEYGIPAFHVNPSIISTVAPPHALSFDVEDGISTTHKGHYSHYMAQTPSDPALGPPRRTPLLPIHSNFPSDLGLVPPPPSQAPGTRHTPTSMAGGSRRKRAASPLPKKPNGKGKCRRVDSDLDEPFEALTDSEDERPVAVTTGHGGRRAGAGNYKDTDLTKLLDLTQKELPLGQRGWQKIHKEYEAWAKANGRPIRDARSLELKFKSLAKQTKPTGAGKRPVAVTRAKAIDRLINERASTCSLNDSDIEGEAEPEDDIEIKVEDSSQIHTATIRSNKSESIQPRRNARAAQSADLMQKLSSALDPDVQRVRDEDRANRSFQNTHIFTLSQQLRDSQASNETLRGEANELRERIHKLERQLDRTRFKLTMHGGRDRRPVSVEKHFRTGRKDLPDLVRVRGKIRHDEFFPKGGCSTTWITDGSTATDWSESDKENYGPYPQSHPLSPPLPSLPRVSTPHPSFSPPQPRGSPGPSYKPQHRKFKVAPPASTRELSASGGIGVPSSPSPATLQPVHNLTEGPSTEASSDIKG